MHAAPPLRSLATIAPWTAAVTSAPASTRNGALPPSSIDVRTTWSAASRSRTLPTSVDPVNDRLVTRGSCSISRTRWAVGAATTTLTTPSGTPARRRTSAIANAVRGVSVAGLSTTEHPAASAGPILRVAIAAGKFHGVMSSETPTGWWVTMMRLSPPGARR